MRKIHCLEVRKKGFDKMTINQVSEMVGWIEPPSYPSETWDVVMADGCGFECSNQEHAQIMASTEEIKALLMMKMGVQSALDSD